MGFLALGMPLNAKTLTWERAPQAGSDAPMDDVPLALKAARLKSPAQNGSTQEQTIMKTKSSAPMAAASRMSNSALANTNATLQMTFAAKTEAAVLHLRTARLASAAHQAGFSARMDTVLKLSQDV